MRKLYMTSNDTIVGDNIDEISIEDFINKIESNINKYFVSYCDDLNFELKYYYEIYKSNDSYVIYHYKDKEFLDKYYLDTSSNINLTSKLDDFCDITTKHNSEKNIYNKYNKGEVCNNKEYLIARNYLNKAIKNHKKNAKIDFFAYIFLISACLPFFSSIIFNNVPAFIAFILFFISGTSLKKISKLPNNTNYINNFSKINMEKLEQIDKIINKYNYVLGDNTMSLIEDKTYEYSDSILNYINELFTTANKLDLNNKKNILLKLEEILNSYKSRIKEFNNRKDNSLTLENNLTIQSDIIKEIYALEIEINKLTNKDMSFEEESNKLYEEISKELNNNNDNKNNVPTKKLMKTMS